MPTYSIIGYNTTALTITGGSISLSTSYNPATDRRIFDIDDGAGGRIIGGRPDFGLRLDGDRYRDETGDDFTQTGVVTSLDGTTTYASGNLYAESVYFLSKPGGGTISVYLIEVDGVFVGYLTSEPLQAGVTYAFTLSNVDPSNAPLYDSLNKIPCFVEGTAILTPDGEKRIETLKSGDTVLSNRGEPLCLRWIGGRTVYFNREMADLRPIRFQAHALGPCLPVRDTRVSPNHRMLVRSPVAQLLFGHAETLIPAKFLTSLPGVYQESSLLPKVTYWHMLFDGHRIVVADGVESESLFPGDLALQGLACETRDEILTLFPELGNLAPVRHFKSTAHQVLTRSEAELLVRQLCQTLAFKKAA
ncbi:Hint domain-containing protein [Rhodovulum imhoffii]|uniref:Hint domain-containing protein n=1 Tax=Rhodovulum imhoffii TaxID=365340 RepID=A0A2T5BVB7_9RHOB|nr:Hint domain-containing protein [Rhodovulum imhoffii]MBK5934221.1 hypothetical protein [Rhodovulum imhoffii]PTN03532.1 Hint domain-containing protein [Rhodovulum imhoffii]